MWGENDKQSELGTGGIIFFSISIWDDEFMGCMYKHVKVGKSEVTCNIKAGCLDKGFSNIPAECEHGISPNAGTHTS